MPKVFLTQAQRDEQRISDLRDCIGTRVSSSMRANRFTIEGTASGLGIGHTTLSRIIRGENVRLDTDTWLKIIDLAGLKLADRKMDAIQKEADR